MKYLWLEVTVIVFKNMRILRSFDPLAYDFPVEKLI